ncbi:MAG: class I SAM-dependent methyltransferase [Bacteroidales bacterium]|nr:class I SAM-dependent methyltransferase [Bacteroidales bacterium]
MLAKAKEKIKADNVKFIRADITKDWDFAKEEYDFVTFSLVLEHLEVLIEIFRKVSRVIAPNGLVNVGSLHHFKQYTGIKVRFETEDGLHIVICFKHNIFDFTGAAKNNGFQIEDIIERFDDGNRDTIPRIITLLLRKL